MTDYPAFLIEMKEALAHFLKQKLGEAVEVDSISAAVVEQIRHHYRGETIYIPKAALYENSLLHQEIVSKFNGDNYVVLAHEYDLSVRTVYRIVKNHLKDQAKKQQCDWIEEE